jgi:hypothetical protein
MTSLRMPHAHRNTQAWHSSALLAWEQQRHGQINTWPSKSGRPGLELRANRNASCTFHLFLRKYCSASSLSLHLRAFSASRTLLSRQLTCMHNIPWPCVFTPVPHLLLKTERNKATATFRSSPLGSSGHPSTPRPITRPPAAAADEAPRDAAALCGRHSLEKKCNNQHAGGDA